MYTKGLKCGCVIRQTNTILDFWIDYCPLHKSAPDLYEALKIDLAFLKELIEQYPKLANDYRVQMLITTNEQALAKADNE